ncbi:hypothetical protein EDC01DRAFT_748007, partial [Geopyxis carbonaria]
ISKTEAQCGDLVRSGYSGYTDARPKMQLWHGIGDATLSHNFQNEVKQWVDFIGGARRQRTRQSNSPLSGWTQRRFGQNVQAISTQGLRNGTTVQVNVVIVFLGL